MMATQSGEQNIIIMRGLLWIVDRTIQAMLIHEISARLLMYSWIHFASMQESEHWERQGCEHQWHQGQWPTEIKMTMDDNGNEVSANNSSKLMGTWLSTTCLSRSQWQHPRMEKPLLEYFCHLSLERKDQRQLFVAADYLWGPQSIQPVEESVDRPSFPELCPSQPLHLCGSRPRPGRPTQFSHVDHRPTMSYLWDLSVALQVPWEYPRWSVHAGVSTLEYLR